MATNTTRGNAKKTTSLNSKSKELVEREPIKGTPFTAIKFGEEWYLTMGKYRLTKGLRTLREVIKASKDASWERVMQIVQIMIDENEYKKIQKMKDEQKSPSELFNETKQTIN